MKRLLFTVWLVITAQLAYSVDIKTLFVEMPDSIMPLLTKSNKLDFLDYADMNMQANATNKLGGVSNMADIKDDYLSLQMTSSSKVDMKLYYGKDSLLTIAIVETVCGGYCDSKITFYNEQWEQLAIEDIIELPGIDDYLNRKAMRQTENRDAVGNMIYRMFEIDMLSEPEMLKVKLTSKDAITDDELRNTIIEREVISFRWNGKRFVRLKQ